MGLCSKPGRKICTPNFDQNVKSIFLDRYQDHTRNSKVDLNLRGRMDHFDMQGMQIEH